ncbi:MAG: serpin family protein, partial [Bacteroidales bacterium]|nr:serpin family protein [Bacteroidales bacterium]
ILLIISINLNISAQEDEYVKSTVLRNNKFSLDFYKHFKNQNSENIVISPFGISNTMAMAYIGSDGETKTQIADKMYYITQFGVLFSFKQLIKRFIIYSSKEVNLLIGNSLWYNETKEMQKKYKNLLKVNFLAHVQTLDYKSSSKKTTKQINRWLKKSSNYNLRSIISPDAINEYDDLIFTNYVYLNGNWDSPFNEEFTSKDDFYLADSTKRKVDFMNQYSYYRYNENELFQIIELPYSGKNISMIIILPKKVNSIDTIENTINTVNLDFWTTELYSKLVKVRLPKFKIDYNQDVSNLISENSCDLPFGDKANFSRITKEKTKISKLIQKTVIEVEENKNTNLTQQIDDADWSSQNSDINYINFNANHQFIFLVKDNINNSILLMGKVISPDFNTLSADFSYN